MERHEAVAGARQYFARRGDRVAIVHPVLHKVAKAKVLSIKETDSASGASEVTVEFVKDGPQYTFMSDEVLPLYHRNPNSWIGGRTDDDGTSPLGRKERSAYAPALVHSEDEDEDDEDEDDGYTSEDLESGFGV